MANARSCAGDVVHPREPIDPPISNPQGISNGMAWKKVSKFGLVVLTQKFSGGGHDKVTSKMYSEPSFVKYQPLNSGSVSLHFNQQDRHLYFSSTNPQATKAGLVHGHQLLPKVLRGFQVLQVPCKKGHAVGDPVLAGFAESFDLTPLM